ncbi:MAG: hypothetical protein UV74_C0013G0555 [Candidatus Woesebacteria bacterium GW2011_GWB1_43_14]|uniref:Probable lipid II flippase MurJ n=1 Tax=Candidatus Woesebacteria bacterium GW2011_GWB1_43_14 TaxID=1618578 RepID=A0A0G1GEY9_9BACT|nr:MAG: hypothetical protein UT21_C0001G0268 [Candidatus Woesebacteria bacterium GW2011_GWA1_39_11b]KKS77988.1 MAG: hypothetical protein UV51_C0003G0023 [Candidatus Woesebacteria bacterium GW2011_GWC1_42_9]KKS97433.1 MAG: hypothetical protein UV74_C0013G0555 [Candidatus Woesebacteria bacterium GW2011_GWB1_43_14]
MFKNLITKSKSLAGPQSTILSAATLIMLMIIVSRIFGFLRLRVLAYYFVDEKLSLFFASFRLPDLIFEVLTLGVLSSAFIPVFTKALKKDEKSAWDIAGRAVNIGLLIFAVMSLVFGLLAGRIYKLIAPGYSPEQVGEVADLAKILFAAQGFFVVSYIMTGVLESQRRFLIPALAPIFYNLGIIVGTILFAEKLDLLAPVIGVIIGASAHFIVQLPLAYRLGFRFVPSLVPDEGLKKIGRLAAPRIIELSFLQGSRMVELFLASMISLGAYAHYNFALSLQALPVGLFGTSMAKAALPTLTSQSDDLAVFRKTLLKTLYQLIFLISPMTMMLIVLRVPVVRLVFGTNIFDWEATLETGFVLSAFALGVPFQAAVALLNRAFYALHNTKTPVLISLFSAGITAFLGYVLVIEFEMSTWAIAAAFSVGVGVQAVILFALLSKKLNGGTFFALLPIVKSILSSLISGSVMFFILKFFDRSVWIKKLSFLGGVETQNINFEIFVIDTRYTFNLLVLTFVTALIGGITYLLCAWMLRSEELYVLVNIFRKRRFTPPPAKESELITVDRD